MTKRKPGRPKVKDKVRHARIAIRPDTHERLKLRAEKQGKTLIDLIDELSRL